MTQRDWRGDRDAVFERDEHACRRCGTTDDEDPNGPRLYPVGDVPLSGTVHRSSLVTVCSPCFESVERGNSAASVPDEGALFDLVRETTERHGVTVSAAAAFASLATALPGELADADPDSDVVTERGAAYTQARREVLLAIESVDSNLERLRALDASAVDAPVTDSLDGFTETGTKLQSELRGIVALNESVVAGLDRCYGCFEPLDPDVDRCSTCELDRRPTDDWKQSPGGAVDFERLFGAINETLQTASETTETLTERTTAVAVQLRGT
ncbi:HNH endonuclease [Natrialbaceae archaeon A-arb3/5]